MFRRTPLQLLALAIAAASAAACGYTPAPAAKNRPAMAPNAAAAKTRAWPPATMSARVETISGGMSEHDAGFETDVPAAEARYRLPNGLAWANNKLYVSHARNYVVTELYPKYGLMWSRLLAGSVGESGSNDGSGAGARFVDPQDMAVMPDGTIAVVDHHGNTIRALRPNGAVSTLLPPVQEPVMAGPYAIAAAKSGNLYVADLSGRQVVKLTRGPGGGWDQTVLYQAQSEEDPKPFCVAVDDREQVYFGSYKTLWTMGPDGADRKVVVERLPEMAWDMEWANGHLVIAAVRRVLDVDLASKAVRSLAGGPTLEAVDGTGEAARFTNAASICFGEPGALYVADSANHRICRLTFGARR